MLKQHFEYSAEDSAFLKKYFFKLKKCPFDRLEYKGTHQTISSITVAQKTL